MKMISRYFIPRRRMINHSFYLHWNRAISSSSSWISNYAQEKNPQLRKQIILEQILPSFTSTPSQQPQKQGEEDNEDRSNRLFKSLSRNRGALATTFALRDDIASLLLPSNATEKAAGGTGTIKTEGNAMIDEKTKSQLKKMDKILQQWLSSSLSLDTLELRRITFDTSSGSILEKVARGESVHRVRSLSELKRRLHDGKRCFALFHPALTDEPLVFIHVGLTTALSKSLAAIDQTISEFAPTHAIFYSVNSPLSALRGLDMASLLIKEVAAYLTIHFPTIQRFSTLSPIPKFMNWLQQQSQKPVQSFQLPKIHDEAIHQAIGLYYSNRASTPDFNQDEFNSFSTIKRFYHMLADSSFLWTRNEVIVKLIGPPLLWIGSYYITKEKIIVNKQSLPLDDVARFHLRNGAVFHSINWMANPSENGLGTSSTMMINYLYDLPTLEENAANFQVTPENIPVGKTIEEIVNLH